MLAQQFRESCSQGLSALAKHSGFLVKPCSYALPAVPAGVRCVHVQGSGFSTAFSCVCCGMHKHQCTPDFLWICSSAPVLSWEMLFQLCSSQGFFYLTVKHIPPAGCPLPPRAIAGKPGLLPSSHCYQFQGPRSLWWASSHPQLVPPAVG